jgi:hypothetical protein
VVGDSLCQVSRLHNKTKVKVFLIPSLKDRRERPFSLAHTPNKSPFLRPSRSPSSRSSMEIIILRFGSLSFIWIKCGTWSREATTIDDSVWFKMYSEASAPRVSYKATTANEYAWQARSVMTHSRRLSEYIVTHLGPSGMLETTGYKSGTRPRGECTLATRS